ncbi:MAG: dihydropteroate synthase [Propionibacteriaceae bacterium]|jgi:dihydropteroate synthase|nr:dihydropteroate synthase [Propionibacteriaceae bacterium]
MSAIPRLDRTLVMGIVNVTPDSFSDGGDHPTPETAIAHGLKLLAQGADILDIGGESTRPGAARITVKTEMERVLPVVSALSEAGAAVSIDTMRAEVAEAAVTSGAVLINDVSGGLSDPQMLSAAAELGVGFVVEHWRAPSATMQSQANYADVVADVRRELAAQVANALNAGIAADLLIVDPGLGFSKNSDHNWALLSHLDSFAEIGCPLLIGASRKRFLGELLAENGNLRPPKERDDATVAMTTLLAERGIWAVRTHSVRAQRDAIAVVGRMAGSHCAAFR